MMQGRRFPLFFHLVRQNAQLVFYKAVTLVRLLTSRHEAERNEMISTEIIDVGRSFRDLEGFCNANSAARVLSCQFFLLGRLLGAQVCSCQCRICLRQRLHHIWWVLGGRAFQRFCSCWRDKQRMLHRKVRDERWVRVEFARQEKAGDSPCLRDVSNRCLRSCSLYLCECSAIRRA